MQVFEAGSKTVVGLERLMLEAAGFDFRSRYPQKLVVKLVKYLRLRQGPIGRTAFDMSIDLFRTFTPLKQTSSTMAIACVELAMRLHDVDLTPILGDQGLDYAKWGTSRAEIMGMCSVPEHASRIVLTRLRNPARPPRPLHSSP